MISYLIKNRKYVDVAAAGLLLLGLYMVSRANYLLFHNLAELFSIIVSCAIFMFAWNARRFMDNRYFLFLGISFLFVGFLDLLHTLAYKGMNIFAGNQANLSTQLWIVARYMHSIALLLAPVLSEKKIKVGIVFLSYSAASALLLMAIFYWRIFPVCFVQGVGLTPFKKISEYLISLIFLTSIVMLLRRRNEFSPDVFRLLAIATGVTICSDLTFSMYKDLYGVFNIIGHYFKIVSSYLMYLAVIRTGFARPYDILFKNLQENREQLQKERDKAKKYLDIAPIIIVVIGADQKVKLINKRGCEQLGYTEEEILEKNWFDHFISPRQSSRVKAAFEMLIQGKGESVEYFENNILTKSGQERVFSWHNTVLTDEAGGVWATLSAGEDITQQRQKDEELRKAHDELELQVNQRTAELAQINRLLTQEISERKETERQIQIRNAILKLSARMSSRQEYFEVLIKLLTGISGCHCVGIRVVNEEGEIPYAAHMGFSEKFMQSENLLSSAHDECVCIRVMSGQTKLIDQDMMTRGGTFRCDDMELFVKGLSEQDKTSFRHICAREGFRSVAIIPIRYKDSYKENIIAAIHLADQRQGAVPLKIIESIESFSGLIGEGIQKINMEDKLRQHRITQSVVNAILRLSLTDIAMDALLQKSLDMISSIASLRFGQVGSIFLVDQGHGKELVLTAHKGFSGELTRKCGRVAFNRCICGQTAVKARMQFVDDTGQHQDMRNKVICPHGHYCVPILFSNEVLGVLNIHIQEGSRPDIRQEEFLNTFSNALAGIIHRRNTEKALAQSNEQVAHILENITDGFLALDRQWRFIYVNGAAERMLKSTRGELLGKSQWEVFTKEREAQIYTHYHKVMTEFVPVTFEVFSATLERWVEIHAYPSGEGLSVYMRDISEKKSAEEKLQQAHLELAQAKRLSDIGALAATVAHELRTPLGVIRTAAYNIKRKAQNPLLENNLGNIEKKVSEADSIINNLLFYSRLKYPHYESVRIFDVLSECIDSVKKKFNQSRILVSKKINPIKKEMVECDPHQMSELFNNILNNAFEACVAQKGAIEVRGAKINDEYISLAFEDNGAGIEPEHLKKLFEPFFTTKARGTGLGLAVCHQIISLHAGKIEIESHKDKGSIFTVVLPIKRKPPQE